MDFCSSRGALHGTWNEHPTVLKFPEQVRGSDLRAWTFTRPPPHHRHTHTHIHTAPSHLCSSLNQFFPEDLTAGSLAALLDRSCNSTRKLARFLKLATTISPSLFCEFTSKTGIHQYPHPEVCCRLGFSPCPPYSDP